jgi:L-alanine-DL-glutamate epimerase-like enolase superfamily enzyme
MNFEVHHGDNSLNNRTNLNVILAIKNCQFFEVLLPAAAQKHGLVEDFDPDAEGFIHALTRPGLGTEIDFDLIERNKPAVLS